MIAYPIQPVALTIAGSDSSGGAGIQADLKTFAALGVYGTSALTAVTAQNTRGVSGVELISPALIAQQISAVVEEHEISAAKTGMLGDRDTINAVAGTLKNISELKLVVDPVMVATSGAKLLSDDAVETLQRELLPLAMLVTPNIDEAAVLLETSFARSEEEMELQARALAKRFATAVLLKGGHLQAASNADPTAADVLVQNDTTRWFRAAFVETDSTHGTGCTLSAAITAECAKGAGLETAISRGKAFVTEALCQTVSA